MQKESDELKSVPVSNKDIPILEDVLGILQNIGQTEQRRERQEEQMRHMTQRMSGMPRGGGSARVLDDAVAALLELDAEYEMQCKVWVKQLRKAQAILNGIPNQTMQSLVMLKYVMDVPDAKIRRMLGMSRRRYDIARKNIEGAQDMQSVKWLTRYVLDGESGS